ncbi:2-oxo acid dehydrogenase subunit E2 [Nocardia farcinica]|uniref:dihydrolipoamide acetyltransferase family protein n=1 Tax=Nocardia farcinica TaxID=37329 RepID=UPI001895E6BB|nr:dihydrolipoamide acetyltransferase family protein [Nocardia farcinica]MBF6260104.1 2-oxo acid dehydrogenase subunit E2 [Nocardia farcinica]
MPEITMPRLSDTMEDGVVSAWLKQVGDPVTRGEVLAEIETDKALMELEAYDDGVLEQILAAEGTRVPIGEPIAIVGGGSGASTLRPNASAQPAASNSAAPRSESAPAVAAENAETAAAPAAAGGSAATEAGERKKSSPLARKIAGELGVDLSAVVGTGPGGRVTKQDVESAHAATQLASAPAAEHTAAVAMSAVSLPAAPVSEDFEEIPLTNIQRVSATRLTESKQQAPHIYLTSAIDVTDLFGFRAQLNTTLAESGAGKVSVNDLLVKAVAVALRANPTVNVSFAGDKLLQHKGIHLGVAVTTPAGLLVPVIRDADRKSVSAIAAESRDKAERARDRKLRPDEMGGGTFTISNLGMFGIEHFTAVINPPEAAILAVGAATDELRLKDGQVVSRKVLRVTMSADHRAIDGAVAAQFLAQVKDLLEHPLRIVA